VSFDDAVPGTTEAPPDGVKPLIVQRDRTVLLDLHAAGGRSSSAGASRASPS
jgi:hypothetical protein